MGFSEFQEHKLSAHVSSRFLDFSDDDDDDSSDEEYFESDSDEKNEDFSELSAHEKWKKSTRKVLLARKFVSEVKSAVSYRKKWSYEKRLRRKFRSCIEAFVLSPVDVICTRSLLKLAPLFRHTFQAWPYSLGRSFAGGLSSKTESRRNRSSFYSLAWIVVQATWGQPFENMLVRTAAGQKVSFDVRSLYNGWETLVFGKIVEYWLDFCFDSSFWYEAVEENSDEKNKDVEENWSKTIIDFGKLTFSMSCQYLIPVAITTVYRHMQLEQNIDSSFVEISANIYSNHGIGGFVPNVAPTIFSMVSSLFAYTGSRLLVNCLWPKRYDRRRFSVAVDRTRSELLKSQGKVIALLNADQFQEVVRSEPAGLVLLHDSKPDSYRSRNMAKVVASKFVGKMLVYEMHVDVLKEMYGESIIKSAWPQWMPFLKGTALDLVQDKEVMHTGQRLLEKLALNEK